MAILDEDQILTDALLDTAKRMVTAAVTAPKAKGISNLHYAVITGADIPPIIDMMEQMGKQYDLPSFIRDAANLKKCEVLVLLGTSISPVQLKKCGMCGFANCTEKSEHPLIPCVFNTGDLGIAVGSAVSVAMDSRIDNRIMYSIGQAVMKMDIFPKEVSIVYGIPLHASKKNIFFDRN